MTFLRRINPNKTVNIDTIADTAAAEGNSRRYSQTHQALERARASFGGEINFRFTRNIIRRDIQRRLQRIVGAYSAVTFEVSDGIPLSKKRRCRREFRPADSRYRAIIRLPGLRFLERVHCESLLSRSSSASPGICDVLLCHQYLSPASLLPRCHPHRPLLFRARRARGFFHVAAGPRANARKEIKSTLMVFTISRHCQRVRKYGSPRAFERAVIAWRLCGDDDVSRLVQ